METTPRPFLRRPILLEADTPLMGWVVDDIQSQAYPENSAEAEKERSIAALLQAILLTSLDSPLGNVIEGAAEKRRGTRLDMPASEFTGILRSSIITFCCEYYLEKSDGKEKFDDRNLLNPVDWFEPLQELNKALDDAEYNRYAEQFINNMYHRNVATTHPKRYRMAEVLVQILSLHGRAPEQVRVLDVGSSIATGVNWQQRKREFQLPFVSVTESEKINARKDQTLTDATNVVLGLPPRLHTDPNQKNLCVDIQRIYHSDKQRYEEGIIEWVLGSARSAERNDPAYREMVLALTNILSSNIEIILEDITDPDDPDFFDKYEDSFDLAILNTSVHQNPKDKQNKMLKTVPRLVKKDTGLVLASEHARLVGGQLRQFQFWHQRGRYGSFILDMAQPKTGWQRLSRYNNSRCDEVILDPKATIDIDGTPRRTRELIMEAAALAA